MLVHPHTLSLITMHKCTAACDHCCFTCSPKETKAIPYERLQSLIDEAREIPSIQLVVFTGGECFMLRDKLDALIQKANSYGYRTRCVTNGYWATSRHTAEMRARSIAEAGLKEINFSTGTFHSRYVPVEYIVHGASACVREGITTLINAELFNGTEFSIETIAEDSELKEMIADKRLIVQRNVWIDNQGQAKLEHQQEHSRFNESRKTGCSTVLDVITINPDLHAVACCGLHLERIPELHLGSIANATIKSVISDAPDDFLKIWMHVEGPERILEFVKQHDPEYKLPLHSVHPCETCLHLYRDAHAKEIISEHYHEVEAGVVQLYMAGLAAKFVNTHIAYEATGELSAAN